MFGLGSVRPQPVPNVAAKGPCMTASQALGGLNSFRCGKSLCIFPTSCGASTAATLQSSSGGAGPLERWQASHDTDIPLVLGEVGAAVELGGNGGRVSHVMANCLPQCSVRCDVGYRA